MPTPDSQIRSHAALLDRVLPDRYARDKAKLELIALAGDTERPATPDADADAADDRWVSRARPTFLYVMYAMILWALPMGVIAGFRPQAADAIARGMTAYLASLPDALYALFGTGYLGYTAARQWGKIAGSDR
jgi:hypothetical protein